MADKKEAKTVEEVKLEESNVVVHLDKDPNDPRNREATPVLPSLNDPGQS